MVVRASGPTSDNIYTIYWFNKSRNDTNGIEHEISFNASIIGNDLQDMGSQSYHSNCPSFYFSCAGVAIENSGGSTGSSCRHHRDRL